MHHLLSSTVSELHRAELRSDGALVRTGRRFRRTGRRAHPTDRHRRRR